ncbi:MAG TPA: FAD-dependent oxidoreductase [candidate division Zixibacteria bacterium]|nr:FAD-dependent oxidoreductase [candidate division Zixibacteria bacterium]
MKVKINSQKKEFPEKTTIMDFLKSENKHIPGLCKMKELDPYGSCRLCLVDVNNRTLPACSTYPRENDEINTNNNQILNVRKTAVELMLSDHYGDCIGPCNHACPTHSEVQNYLALVANGKYHEAVALMKKDYILPASLGRVCPAFCERDCRRNLVEQPVAIRQLKRFAADYDLANDPWMPEIPKSTGKKIAIVGGGPAGLAAAFYSRIKGHNVTIFEAMSKLGGMLRYGIPEYRLPKAILDQDIDTVIKTGIKVKTNTRIGEDISFKELQETFDAVYVAIGAWQGYQLQLEGCEMPGVMDAIEFLRKISLGEKVDIGNSVMVIGGGNSAMDVARTARRLGADVTITYRRTKNEMPAEKIEIEEAEEEGIHFNILSNPVKILGEDKVDQVELVKMELGEPDESGRCRPVVCEGSNYCIQVDTVIFAIGQRSDSALLQKFGLETRVGWIEYDEITYETNIPGVFTGGDIAISPNTVIEAIATGKEGAIMMDLYLKGKLELAKDALGEPWEKLDEIEADEEIKNLILTYRPYNHWKKVTEEDYKERERIERIKAKVLPPDVRAKNFDEVESTITEDEAIKEVNRCMSCGCLDSFECKLREYAKLYGAKQETYDGELHYDQIDESHPFVILDNNKCILCGRCINLTHEITGEGLIDNLNRGFETKNGPPVGMKLGDVKGDFVGSFVDDCPTGAFVMNTPFPKNGPWNVTPMPTVCYGCGIGCEMNIDIYKGFAVNVSSKEDSWNHGLVCDKPRFNRMWEKQIEKPMKKIGNKFVEITIEEAKEILKKNLKDLVLILTPEVTNDEAKQLITFSKEKGIKIGAVYKTGISTAKFAQIFNSKRINLKVELSQYPLLKPFIHIAKKQGAIITDQDYDISIVNAPAEPEEDIPTIIMHKGLNEVGLIKLGLEKIPKAKNYLVIGFSDVKFSGFTISMGYNENADLILPMPAWISRSGKIENIEGRELEVKKIIDGPKILDIIKSMF